MKAIPKFHAWGAACLAMLAVLGTARAATAAEEESDQDSEKSDDSKAASSDSDDAAQTDTKSHDEKSDGAPPTDSDVFGHGGQVGARVGIVGGYRMILRYDDSPLCAKFDPDKGLEQQKFCGHGAPWALTTALSFGIADWLEPYAWGRFGLESEPETYTKPALMFGAGVRVYTMSDAPFKIFIEPAIGLELEDSTTGADFDTDFALHLAAGPQLDFAKYVGASLTAGVTTTVIRYLATSLDVELAVQGRY